MSQNVLRCAKTFAIFVLTIQKNTKNSTIRKTSYKMSAKNLNMMTTEKTLNEKLIEVERKVTKLDKYNACIALGEPERPVDIKTVDQYLKGTVPNEKFGEELLSYLEGRAAARA